MNPNDPAFPTNEPSSHPRGFYTNPGLTRREYFAIRFAAEGYASALANLRSTNKVLSTKEFEEHSFNICNHAVSMADKLCAELSRKEV